MFSDQQLSHFKRYVETTPKHLLGLPEAGPMILPSGAYDAIRGASAHGFGMAHRRPSRGAHDAAPKTGSRAGAVLAWFAERLSAEEWAQLGALLRGDASESAEDELDPRGGELEARGGEMEPRGMDSRRRFDDFARGNEILDRDFAESFPYAATIGQA